MGIQRTSVSKQLPSSTVREAVVRRQQPLSELRLNYLEPKKKEADQAAGLAEVGPDRRHQLISQLQPLHLHLLPHPHPHPHLRHHHQQKNQQKKKSRKKNQTTMSGVKCQVRRRRENVSINRYDTTEFVNCPLQ